MGSQIERRVETRQGGYPRPMAVEGLTGVVLAGGESRRFGSDKAWAMLDSRTLFDRVCGAVAEACQRVLVVAPTGRKLPMTAVSYTRVDDAFPGEGPLGAMLTAFREIRTGAAFATACDTPLLDAAIIERLARERGPAAISAAETSAGAQPLCAVYDVEACAGAAGALFSEGERSLRALLARVPTVHVVLSGREAVGLRSVNTQADLRALAEALEAASGTGQEARG
jgi:molybdopterin-guanine dinucleotide biosynthesis protein A